MRSTVLGLTWLIGSLAPAWAQPASRFDGSWLVAVDCAPTSDGAQPYRISFLATVRGGMLQGERGTQGMPTWLALSGQIGADGRAMLLANGLTGQPTYSLRRVQSATPFTYHVSAHFDPASGEGQRVEQRACGYRFTRQP